MSKGNDGTPMRAIQTVEVPDTGTTEQASEIENVRDPIAKAKQFPHTKNLRQGASKNDAQQILRKCLKIRLLEIGKILDIRKVIFLMKRVPVNKVFTPDVGEQLWEVSTMQQCSPYVTCPVVQELEDDVPTDVDLGGVTVMRG